MGYEADVDDDDFDRLKDFSWQADVRKSGQVYATRKLPRNGGKLRKLYMHHDIMAREPPLVVDHINGHTLDNQKINLRLCSHAENIKNQKLRSDNTSGACGVRWHREKNLWQAYIKVNGQSTHLGYFGSFDDAVAARKQREIKLNWVKRRENAHCG